MAEKHQAEPLKSSLIEAGECSPPKVGGEFYIIGATLTPPIGDTTAAEAIATITLNEGKKFSKTLRAVGKRTWGGNWAMPTISEPAPLKPIALTYENAYGGADKAASPTEPQPTCLANYAGLGYLTDAKRCTGVALPQLETAPFIKSPTDRPNPAGFAPMPAFWSPRREELGTVDVEAAKRGACPYSADTQASLHNTAPLDQRFAKPWQGGEVLTLSNILSGLQYGKTCSITLPRITPQLSVTDKGKTRQLNSVCDTFWIDASKNQLYLIYRAAYPTTLAYPDSGLITVSDALEVSNDNQQEAA